MNGIADSWDDILRSTDSKYTEFLSRMPVVPVSEFCCVKPVPQHQLSESKKKKIREEILELFPDSPYAKHMARYKSWKENVKTCGKKSRNMSVKDESSGSIERINTDDTLSKLLAACPNSILAQSLRPKRKKEMAEQPHPVGSSKRLTRSMSRATRKSVGS